MTVYAVQRQKKWSSEHRDYRFIFDLASTDDFGELCELLPADMTPFRPLQALEALHEKLQDFSDNDYLLMIGNPILMGMAFTVAASYNHGRVRALQWNRKKQRYIEIKIFDL